VVKAVVECLQLLAFALSNVRFGVVEVCVGTRLLPRAGPS